MFGCKDPHAPCPKHGRHKGSVSKGMDDEQGEEEMEGLPWNERERIKWGHTKEVAETLDWLRDGSRAPLPDRQPEV